MSIVPDNIRNKAPNCSLAHFFCDASSCTSSFNVCTTVASSEPQYNWSVKFQCTLCDKVWWLCRECSLRKKITSRTNLLRHQYSNHKVNHVASLPNKTKRQREADINPFENVTEENYSEAIVNDIIKSVTSSTGKGGKRNVARGKRNVAHANDTDNTEVEHDDNDGEQPDEEIDDELTEDEAPMDDESQIEPSQDEQQLDEQLVDEQLQQDEQFVDEEQDEQQQQEEQDDDEEIILDPDDIPTLHSILVSNCNDYSDDASKPTITPKFVLERAISIQSVLLREYKIHKTKIMKENEADLLNKVTFDITWAEWYFCIFRKDVPIETNQDSIIQQWEDNNHYNDSTENGVDVVLDNDSDDNDNDSDDNATNNHRDSIYEQKESITQKNLNEQKHLNDLFDKLVVSKSKTNILELVLQDKNVHFVNQKTTQYYSFDMVSSGKKFLIINMMNRFDSSVDEIMTNISDEEVDCQILLSQFVLSLTRNQQIEFGNVINSITKSYMEPNVNTLCTLPKSLADIRRQYVDGVDAVTKHLPIPDIRELKNHSYVSIKDLIADFLLSNRNKLKMLDDYKTLHNEDPSSRLDFFYCNRVKQIIRNADIAKGSKDDPVIVLFLKLWSDDFDPNNSIKSNRQSVWIKTLTICAMTETGHKVSYTYPISSSAKNADHEEVECLISNELEMLKSGNMQRFFYRYLSLPVHVYADLYCILADQPERRSTLGLAAGNSRYHKRFGLLLDYNASVDVIRCCKNCEKGIMFKAKFHPRVGSRYDGTYWELAHCEVCSTWLLFHEDHEKLLYEPESSYPESKLSEEPKLKPKYVTRNHMQSCIDDVYDALQTNQWTVINCKAFLRTEGFNQKHIDDIVDYAMNNISYLDAKNNKENDINRWKVIKKDYDNDPRKYQKWCLPSSWYTMFDTSLYVDVPMHLLLLGVAKAVFIKIAKWLKLRMQSTEFKSLSVGVLDALKLYNIGWCKILQYPYSSTDKFGGWVAENFLAMVRLSPWFYTLLYELKEPKERPDLETPYTAWTMAKNKYWLELRGLSVVGKAKELKDRVRKYMNMETKPPIIQNDLIDVEYMLELVTSLNHMISYLLSPNTKYGGIGYIEVIIRKFLIIYDNIDSRMGKKNQPSWLTQYNFLCLLNLPNVMRQFGSVRNMWEGGVEGEGFLRSYKKELKNGLKPKWQIYTLKNLLQRSVFSKAQIDTTNNWVDLVKLECRIYQSLGTIKNVVVNKKPISCVIDDETKQVYIVFRQKQVIKAIKLDVNWNSPTILNNLRYHELKLLDDIVVMDRNLGNKVVGCLLLPNITPRLIRNINCFCIVYSDWRISTNTIPLG